MPEPARIGLDNPVFNGRLRRPLYTRPAAEPGYSRRRPMVRRFDHQVSKRPAARTASRNTKAPLPVWMHTARQPDQRPLNVMPVSVAPPTEPQPPPAQVPPKQQRSNVLKRQFVRSPEQKHGQPRFRPSNYSKLQLALVTMACLVFVVGLTVSLQTLLTNHNASAQVSALSKQVEKQSGGNQNGSVPSTVKPSGQAISQYVVAADLPRYLNIPELGIHARVLQVGVTTSGALGTPSNVFDTAWYTGSAKPGQPGATLIDGHVSSWTTHGVFYGIKTLKAGDTIQIVRGDGAVLNYQVVKTQVYNSNDVDMQAAVTPITAGKSGLNLITCTGQVEKGTSEFNERVIVFAQQV